MTNKPIFYRSKDTGDIFKVVILTEYPALVAVVLDLINEDFGNYITESEFESEIADHESETRKIELQRNDGVNEKYVIGKVTSRKSDLNR